MAINPGKNYLSSYPNCVIKFQFLLKNIHGNNILNRFKFWFTTGHNTLHIKRKETTEQSDKKIE